MKSQKKLFAITLLCALAIFSAVNIIIATVYSDGNFKDYAIDVNRISYAIENNESYSLRDYPLIIAVTEKTGDNEREFYEGNGRSYCIRFIGDKQYRFDYAVDLTRQKITVLVAVNAVLLVVFTLVAALLIYIRVKIFKPFTKLSDVPYELSKGNLTIPLKEEKSRYFGRFVWGVDLLRENIEEQRQKELELQKDKKTLLMSISHDIKTPLSAIKLYSKALSVGLYNDKQKQLEVASSIGKKADEIEDFISQLMTASNEDFLQFDIHNDDFYADEFLKRITDYYTEKLALLNVDFDVARAKKVLLHGDIERAVEAMQNIIENALKYGDGNYIKIKTAREEDCELFTIINSGCTLSENELTHIFDSFWRGSNTKSASGSGLGLYICKQLMKKMDGDIYARLDGGDMSVTLVFRMS